MESTKEKGPIRQSNPLSIQRSFCRSDNHRASPTTVLSATYWHSVVSSSERPSLPHSPTHATRDYRWATNAPQASDLSGTSFNPRLLKTSAD